MAQGTASKYGNRRTVVDNITFDSKAEARRYQELKLALQTGGIRYLKVHPTWELHCADGFGERAVVCKYEADFMYFRSGDMYMTVEDVKGHRTAMYRLKKKWLLLEYGIEIQEIEA